MRINQARIIFLFILTINLLSCSNANNSTSSEKRRLKILAIFPHMGKSHFFVFKPLIEELARRGNELTVISYFPRTEKNEHLPTYKDISLVNNESDVFVNVIDLKKFEQTIYIYKYFMNIYMLYNMNSIACENLKHPAVKELSENGGKFDLVLIENFNTNCFMGFVHKLNVPFIDISTHQPMPWAIHNLRLHDEASFIPMVLTSIPKPMNLFHRTMNTLSFYVSTAIYYTVFHWKDQSIVEEIYGPDIPNVITINKNMSLFFVNTHYTLQGGISYPPNVIEVGGIHIESKRKPLPRNIAKFLDEAHEGVLYFNLGSMIKMSTMPKNKLNILIKVFRSIPRKVIWKWEQDDIPELPGNVMVQKWLPQYDILSHPNVKCYFGHGGLLGLTEGVQSGVPMILMPFYGDQYSNVAAARTRGVAIILEFNELTEEKLRDAVDQIFNNTRYRENAKRLSKAFKDRPASPLETAIWWIEYVARGNGLPYVRSEAVTMPWHERYLADVHAVLLLLSLLALYAQYRLVKYAFACVPSRSGNVGGSGSGKRRASLPSKKRD